MRPDPSPLLAAAAWVGFAASLGWALVEARRTRGADVSRSEAERALAEMRLRLLQARLSPSILLGAMEALARLVDENAAAAEKLLLALSEFLRSVVQADRTNETTVAQELASSLSLVRVLALSADRRVTCGASVGEESLDRRVAPGALARVMLEVLEHLPRDAPGGVHFHASLAPGGEALRLSARVAIAGVDEARAAELLDAARRIVPRIQSAAALRDPAEGGDAIVVRVDVPIEPPAPAS